LDLEDQYRLGLIYVPNLAAQEDTDTHVLTRTTTRSFSFHQTTTVVVPFKKRRPPYVSNPQELRKVPRKDKRRPRFSFFISNCQRTRQDKNQVVRLTTSVAKRQSISPARARWCQSHQMREARRQLCKPPRGAAPPSSMAGL